MGGVFKMALGLFGGGGASMMLPLILGAGLLLASGGGYLYISKLRAEMQLQAEVNGQLTDAIAAKDEVMQAQQEDLTKQLDINRNISNQWKASQKEKTELEEKFKKAEGLAAAAVANPADIEMRINRGTEYALRCNEIATGALLRDSDKDNTICQDQIMIKRGVK